MGKAAAKTKTTTSADDVSKYMDILNARSKFLATTLGMGWRLAITVLVPLVGGIKIDQHFKSSPSYTLAGFFLSAAGGAAVVWNSVKQVNAEQAEEEAIKNKSKVKEQK